MKNLKWNNDNTVSVNPPKRPKKITGTRFAAIMGLNSWSTPFEAWCAITRTYEKPFTDTKYTLAGKAIEPKQAQYMKNEFFMSNIVYPHDIFGEDYFQNTYGDFFKDSSVFGGMWDYLLRGGNGKITTVLEMKTTKRVEDWADDIPEYYAYQASLYAWLLGIDEVIMVCSFLEDSDYDHPEDFSCSPSNTIIRPFKVSERYPDFEEIVRYAETWWEDHVLTGISPKYDAVKDAEILQALRTVSPQVDSDVDALIKEAAYLTEKINEASKSVASDEKRLKAIKESLKKFCLDKFGDGDTKVTLSSGDWEFSTSKSVADGGYDISAMIADGLDIEKYHNPPKETYKAMFGRKKADK